MSDPGPPAHRSTGAPVPVVCALIERDGRLLIARRPAHKHLPGKWEFPGGKVEPGEPAPAALVREIREELGCRISIRRALPPFPYDYGTVVIEMIPFVCAIEGADEPVAHEHTAIQWVAPGDLATVDLAPADWPALEAYRKLRLTV